MGVDDLLRLQMVPSIDEKLVCRCVQFIDLSEPPLCVR
jgi:hypothetical protein